MVNEAARLRLLHDLKILVIQRVFRDHLEEICLAVLRLQQREAHILQHHTVRAEENNLILLRPDVYGRARRNTVLHLRRGRRVQFLLCRLQRLGNIAVQSVKDRLAARCQMRMIRYDCLHGGPHHGQNEITLTDTGVHFLVSGREGRHAGDQIPAIRESVCLAKAIQIIPVLFDDRFKLAGNTASFRSDTLFRQISGIRIFFGFAQIPFRSNQLPDAFFNLRPAHGKGILARKIWLDGDSRGIMIFPIPCSGDGV